MQFDTQDGFTPGPWVIGTPAPDAPARHTVRDKSGWSVADIPGMSPGHRHPRADANARLIAAAPAMFAALGRMVQANAALLAHLPPSLVSMAEEALALATGKASEKPDAPKCSRCKRRHATVRADVESPREERSAELLLCEECFELANGLGCYIDVIERYPECGCCGDSADDRDQT